MRTPSFKTIAAVILLTLNGSNVSGQKTIDYGRIDTLLATLVKNDKFMGSVAVSKDGKLVYSKAVGFADNEKKIPATTKTIYRIGSVSKMFTAVMIYQLIEEKKLTSDAKLSAFFPSVEQADKITIQDMLMHRSGIWSVTDDSLYLDWCIYPKSRTQIISMIQSHPPVFQPGEKSEYSNSNFILLGYIIEDLTGKDYAANLLERICNKSGLTSTQYGGPANTLKNESYSYSPGGGGWKKENETDMTIPHGAGAICSTAEDLVLFANDLFGGKLISKAMLEDMTESKDTYGKGIFPMPFYEMKGFGHTGGIDGFRSVLIHFPGEKLSVAVCSNALNYNQNEILIGLLSIIEGKAYDLPVFATTVVDPEILKRYEGVYSTEGFPLKLTIKLEGTTLTAHGTGQAAFPLEATGEKEFKYDAAGIRMIFLDGDQLNIKQGGLDLVMKRE